MKKLFETRFALLIILVIGFKVQAQSKKWTLEDCVTYAIKNNISIKQVEFDIKLSDIDKKSAIGDFLPTLNGNATHSWNIGLNQNITTGLLENQTNQFSSAGFNSNIDIYNGLQNQNRLRKAKMSQLASQYQLSKMKDDISLNVANAYLQVLMSKENLKIQTDQLDNTKKQLMRTEELVKAGAVPRGDLLDVKATLAADNQKVVLAENSLFLSKLSLAQLLQLKEYQDFDITESVDDVSIGVVMAENPEAIVDKAKKDRIEIKIANKNLELAEQDLKIAKGAYQPRLSGFYSFSTRVSYSDRIVGFDSNNNPILESPLPFFDQLSNNKGHNFGLQLNIPIFNGFATENAVSRSKVAVERSKVAITQEELDLERNVYTAFTDAKGSLKNYDSALQTLEARQEAFNYAKERNAVGIMNAFDLSQSRTLLVNAQSEVVRAKYDYMFKVKVVEFYFGIPLLKN